ncbi:hypothetical protein AAFF_G00214690 [Aldrovandia affinis]|uniref:RUN and SH3 domain-containing protein 1 n=1 Tax=Aldrovandia affinis TaxID=143900 RepID=A0AAD7RH26_9TELE|nr:hypothetical protein AAFF_G00214690 [Aldrovandia affinis]
MDNNEGDDEEEDDDEDDDTLVPSCRDCPPSLLELSLTSSTSSSSTSISSCSDFETDGPDAVSPSSKELAPEESPMTHSSPLTSVPQIIPLDSHPPPLPPLPLCSPDEGYPSARSSPSTDFREVKGSLVQECTRLDLLSLLDSMEELGKRDLFNQVVQVARWELEGDLELRDRLDHLQKLEQVNMQVKVAHMEKLQEARLDLGEGDLSDDLDEMASMNMDTQWKLYKGHEIRKLLVLAGLTQAELLKLSPELGVCVTGVLEDGDEETSETVRPVAPPGRVEDRENGEGKEMREGTEIMGNEWSEGEGKGLGIETVSGEDEPEGPGLPAPGADVSRLSSPLFPRSYTIPALAAPLYYPSLYPTPAIAPVKEPQVPMLTKQPQLCTLIRSVSFAGSVQRGEAWMADDVRGPLGGQGLSSSCLQEKRALLSAVSVAVEAILAQFSSSRTLVQKSFKIQKSQSGDSSINPSLGRLVLQCLCPALRGLLSDGLKPHQSDLIAGRRPNSPWGLVQASTRPGPSTQALCGLQCRVAELPQLKQNRHRFNAFLLGLLNIKLLDYWLSHLQSCDGVLTTYYHPTSFMRLTHTSCQPLFEELLLLLQPLSLLTFNLDLLFQHHHLDPASPGFSSANHSPETPSPANQDSSFRVLPRGFSLSSRPLASVSEQDFRDLDLAESTQKMSLTASANHIAGGVDGLASHSLSPATAANKGETSPQLLWLQDKEIVPPSVSSLSQQAGQAIQQGWGAVMRWGERLGQNLGSYYIPEAVTCEGDKPHSPPQDIWSDCSSNTLTQLDLVINQPQSNPPSESSPTVPWGLGRLFGASGGHRNPKTRTPPARRPSHWLSPGVSALTRVVSPIQYTVPGEISREPDSEGPGETEETGERARPLRSVRTLCNHMGTGEELSFQKGEELTVLEGVDSDWVRCRRGDKEGLVPIGYTSLIM